MAIAFDANAMGGVANPGTSLTWSHTCTGSHRMLFVAAFGPTSGANAITGVTYAGVAMTLVTTVRTPSNTLTYVFALANPASGANNVVVSASSSVLIGGTSNSYTGCAGTIDNHATGTNTPVMTLTTAVTTVANNCWTFIAFRSTAGTNTAGSGVTNRTGTSIGFLLGDSNAPKTPAGSVSMTVTNSTNAGLSAILVSFAPFVPIVASGQMMDLL